MHLILASVVSQPCRFVWATWTLNNEKVNIEDLTNGKQKTIISPFAIHGVSLSSQKREKIFPIRRVKRARKKKHQTSSCRPCLGCKLSRSLNSLIGLVMLSNSSYCSQPRYRSAESRFSVLITQLHVKSVCLLVSPET